MSNKLKLLITETSVTLVDALDGKILMSSKKQVAEKMLEQFAAEIIAIDAETTKPPTTAS